MTPLSFDACFRRFRRGVPGRSPPGDGGGLFPENAPVPPVTRDACFLSERSGDSLTGGGSSSPVCMRSRTSMLSSDRPSRVGMTMTVYLRFFLLVLVLVPMLVLELVLAIGGVPIPILVRVRVRVTIPVPVLVLVRVRVLVIAVVVV